MSEPAVGFVRQALGKRSIVLVGMMGAGKSTVGIRLARRLSIPFYDADAEIESAAGMPIPDLFARHGEAEFRKGESRVIARLLNDSRSSVLATGGGAFMSCETRARISDYAISVWLMADIDVLWARVRGRHDRPLLDTREPRETLRSLLAEREPRYQLAHLAVGSGDVSPERTVEEVIAALGKYLRERSQNVSSL